MPDFRDRMADYVEVADRVQAFVERYPEGSLQSEIVLINDDIVVVKAWAYRYPADERPGIGHSSMLIPGTTPYTRGSELENAETSAWGRAIAALGFEVRRGIASRDEIANKQEQRQGPSQRRAGTPRPPEPRNAQNRVLEASTGTQDELLTWAGERGLSPEVVLDMLGIDSARFNRLTAEQAERAKATITAKMEGGNGEG